MKITLGTAVLAAGGSEGPANFRVTSSWSVQTVDLVRAPHGEQWNRANLRHEVAFGVTRLHGTTEEAMAFILDHGESLPKEGILSFLSEGTRGTRRWIARAVLLRADCVQQIGVTTIWSYQLAGGEVLKTDPRLVRGITT